MKKLKRLTLLIAALFLVSAVNAQDKTNQKAHNPELDNYNHWSIEIQGGVTKPVKPFAPGYFTTTPTFGQGGLGVRYMINNYFGFKLDGGYASFKNADASNDFKSTEWRVDLEGVANLGNMFHFRDWTNTFNLLAHTGLGYQSMKVKEPSEVGPDGMINYIVGITPQIRLGNHVALILDGSFIGSFKQNYTFDGTQSAGMRGLTGRAFNGSIGFDFYLGSAEKHADWYKSGNGLEKRVSALEDQVGTLTDNAKDSDGDGVADQYDNCADTPDGVAVDSHGCPLDTDGDGVPDYKDKQLITPTYCQPVDEDGVGKCPVEVKKPSCDLGTLPTVNFDGKSVELSSDAKQLLGNVANQMRQSPACRVVVSGHAGSSKSSEQLAWDRVNTIINYMSETEGIAAGRFIFKYKSSGDINAVDLRSANKSDAGANMVAPPHPNLRRSK